MSLFDPRDIASLAIWLDAQDTGTLTFNSTTISSWRNKGTKGAGNAVQATAVNQPLYVASAINSKPALQGRHDGSNASQLAIADAAALDYTACTLFAVVQRVTDLGATEHIAGKFTTASPLDAREHAVRIDASDQLFGQGTTAGTGASSVTATIATAIATGTPFIPELLYDGTNITIRRDGRTGSLAALASIFNGTAGYNLFSIDSLASPFAGYIGELLFFTAALSVNNRSKVLRYLSAKWGIIL